MPLNRRAQFEVERSHEIYHWVQLPPLGLPGAIEVKFVHGCADGCKCRPTVSTCKLVLKIPVHASTFANMKEMMTSAMLQGFGFGKL
jgi:hypothetical protein